jgi:hypothetical protein
VVVTCAHKGGRLSVLTLPCAILALMSTEQMPICISTSDSSRGDYHPARQDTAPSSPCQMRATQTHRRRQANKLARTFATQMEALKRYRTGGQQKVTVEHVTVTKGGQAIVGNVSQGGGGGSESER